MNCFQRSGMIEVPLFAASETVWFSRVDGSDRLTFRVNDSPARNVDFEDLTGLYLKESSRFVYCCSIQCEGKSYQICRLGSDEFWEIVKGKRFKVVVDTSMKRIQEDAFDSSMSISNKVNLVFALLDTGKNQELKDYLKKSPCYQFVETTN